jgi:hypothetical protein
VSVPLDRVEDLGVRFGTDGRLAGRRSGFTIGAHAS